MKESKKQIEDDWNKTWKDILLKKDGSIDMEQLKIELFDFSQMIDRMIKVTCAMTNDKLSKPTYPAHVLISIMEECKENNIEDRMIDDKYNGVCSFCEQDISK